MFESCISARATEKFTWLGDIPREHDRQVLRHGRSCEEMRGTFCRIGELDKVTAPCLDDHHFEKEELECQIFVVKMF